MVIIFSSRKLKKRLLKDKDSFLCSEKLPKEMKCSICKREGSIQPAYNERNYCRKHFKELIQKRIRKELRVAQALDLKKTYRIIGEEPEKTFLKEMLKEIYQGRLKLVEKGGIPISAQTMESYASTLFETFLNKKVAKRVITPLRRVSKDDVAELGFTSTQKIHPLLEALNHKQVGSFFSILSSLESAIKNRALKH